METIKYKAYSAIIIIQCIEISFNVNTTGILFDGSQQVVSHTPKIYAITIFVHTFMFKNKCNISTYNCHNNTYNNPYIRIDINYIF